VGKKRIGITENTTYNQDIIGGKAGYGSTIQHMNKVIIGQVHGFAYGGGFARVLTSCDIIVVADDASVGSPNLRFTGFTAGPWQSVGLRAGKWIGSSGEPMTGVLAQEVGLAFIHAPIADLERVTDELAEEIAQQPLEDILYLKGRFNSAMALQKMNLGLSAGGGGGFTSKPEADEPNFWGTVSKQGLKAGLASVYSAAPRISKVMADPGDARFAAGGAGQRVHTAEERARDIPRDLLGKNKESK
jgi:enoyl-CoA hydratase/carnithine racemase